jgi:hypothetical protein
MANPADMNPQVLIIILFLNALLVVSAVSAKTKRSAVSAKAKQTVRLASPCKVTGQHGVDRWPAKTDPESVPSDKSKITSITPSQVFAWPGVGVGAHLTKQSPRSASEQRWFALTGFVAGMKIEADGDIHIELVDANDNKTGIVGAEIPPGQIWCDLRNLALSWTTQKFPFSFSSSKNLTVTGRHVITVTGKAFYDVDHAPKDRSNQRIGRFPPGYAVWEIHPVIAMTR